MNKFSKKIIVQAIIEKYEQEENDLEIQTSIVEGYTPPGRIVLKNNRNKGYIPDVLLRSPDSFELFEVEFGLQYEPEKWRLFSLYSHKENGHFNIVTPEDQLPQMRDFLNRNKINAKILYFS